jgi:hypothetical protein
MRDELAAGAAAQATGPDDARMYLEAIDDERAGDLTAARKAHFELIKNYPSSPLSTYAYVAFGDMFAAEGDSDPTKWQIARQAYEKVMAYPPPTNRAYAYVMERHALCAEKMDDHARALASAKKAIEAARTYPQLPVGSDVAESARRTLITAYAAAGNPTDAFQFFQFVDPQLAPEMCVALGEQYVKRGQDKELVTLYRDILTRRVALACEGALRAIEELERKGADARVAAAVRTQWNNYCRTP